MLKILMLDNMKEHKNSIASLDFWTYFLTDLGCPSKAFPPEHRLSQEFCQSSSPKGQQAH